MNFCNPKIEDRVHAPQGRFLSVALAAAQVRRSESGRNAAFMRQW
jgi:hypothetical protein